MISTIFIISLHLRNSSLLVDFDGGGGLSVGAIVGIVLASCVILLLILVFLWMKGFLGKKDLGDKGTINHIKMGLLFFFVISSSWSLTTRSLLHAHTYTQTRINGPGSFCVALAFTPMHHLISPSPHKHIPQNTRSSASMGFSFSFELIFGISYLQLC